jgi:hypothetical protein
MDAANTDGLHVILYGDRGTGKTSIAKVLRIMLQEPNRKNGRRVLTASCNSADTYSSSLASDLGPPIRTEPLRPQLPALRSTALAALDPLRVLGWRRFRLRLAQYHVHDQLGALVGVTGHLALLHQTDST